MGYQLERLVREIERTTFRDTSIERPRVSANTWPARQLEPSDLYLPVGWIPAGTTNNVAKIPWEYEMANPRHNITRPENSSTQQRQVGLRLDAAGGAIRRNPQQTNGITEPIRQLVLNHQEAIRKPTDILILRRILLLRLSPDDVMRLGKNSVWEPGNIGPQNISGISKRAKGQPSKGQQHSKKRQRPNEDEGKEEYFMKKVRKKPDENKRN